MVVFMIRHTHTHRIVMRSGRSLTGSCAAEAGRAELGRAGCPGPRNFGLLLRERLRMSGSFTWETGVALACSRRAVFRVAPGVCLRFTNFSVTRFRHAGASALSIVGG